MNPYKYRFDETIEREIIAHINEYYRERFAWVKASRQAEYIRCMTIVDERMDELPYE